MVTTYTYDKLNRVTGKSYANDPSGTPAVAYTYDTPIQGWNFIDQASPKWTGVQQANLIGRLSYATNGSSTVVYGYDPLGRTTLKSTCTPSTCGTDHYDLHASYDLGGNVAFADRGLDAARNAASPGGYYYGGLTFSYNPASQLFSAQSDVADAAHPQFVLSTLNYTPFGKVSTVELGQQYGQVSGYDKRNRMTDRTSINLSGYTVLADHWNYDAAGNVMETDDSAQGSITYMYDKLNRVMHASLPPYTEDYQYDPWGNQTAHMVLLGTNYQWAYMPTVQNRASNPGTAYDSAGNMLSDGLHNYTWDAENRIAAVTDQGVAYKYDPEGRRVATVTGGAVTAEYLYTMAGELATTVDASGNLVRTVLRDNGGTHWGDWIGAAGPGGVRTEFRLVNQVGTLEANGDTQGNYVESCMSGPFGDGQVCNPGYDYTETHFTDKLRDQETNNDYFDARYFDSVLSRFMSPDWSESPEPVPYADLMDPQTLNLYSYVGNNPISRVDRDGHQAAVPAPLGPLPLFFPQQQITQQQAGQIALDIRDFVSTLGQVLNEDASRIGAAASAVGQALTAGDGQSEADTPVATEPTLARPLVGNNPREAGTRTNTDLPGGHDAARDTFADQTAGQNVATDPKTGHQVSDDGSRLRLYPDGTARVDLPNRGPKPNGETVHFNDQDANNHVPRSDP